jgi:hypothetical protein
MNDERVCIGTEVAVANFDIRSRTLIKTMKTFIYCSLQSVVDSRSVTHASGFETHCSKLFLLN